MIPCLGEIKTNFRRESTYRKNLPKEGSKATGPKDVNLQAWAVEQRKLA